jgi:hypothetical protein
MDKNYQQYLKAYFKKAATCVERLRSELPNVAIHVSQSPDAQGQLNYYAAAQVFNTRFQYSPLAVVYCEKPEHVSIAYNAAIANEIPIRVRAGGHDHEGESSGTNVVVIDVSKMDYVKVDKATGIAKIGAGNRFTKLVKDLADEDVMIPHGTCTSVGVTGFTLGGGWGPWTRKKGLNCESLKGATLMLGDGTLFDVDEDENGDVPPLLWALRGGGGMSYGIVTELRVQTFPLPDELLKFTLDWNEYDDNHEALKDDKPTLNILKAWENAIKSTDTHKLIGTNIKINARPEVADFDYTQIAHNCSMYGFWEGSKAELNDFVAQYFANVWPKLSITGRGGKAFKDAAETLYRGDTDLMNDWHRESFSEILKKRQELEQSGLLKGKPILPDLMDPAPHKLTSRLVNKEGLGHEGEEGYKQLLLSITSPLVFKENRGWGLFTYLTLNALVGDYYRNNPDKADKSAFPYKDKLYTIQYQTWWNKADKDSNYGDPSQSKEVYNNINRAMDWVDAGREWVIPNTSGAFISFKDISIPTSVYFDKNYEKLKAIKIEHSRDPNNHLRTRKTII